MPVGTVKWYDCRKGFGFVIHEDGTDVFVHYTVIEGEGFRRLFDGEQVEYDLEQGPKGMLASRVKRLNPGPRRPVSPPDQAHKQSIAGKGMQGYKAVPPGGGVTPPEKPTSG